MSGSPRVKCKSHSRSAPPTRAPSSSSLSGTRSVSGASRDLLSAPKSGATKRVRSSRTRFSLDCKALNHYSQVHGHPAFVISPLVPPLCANSDSPTSMMNSATTMMNDNDDMVPESERPRRAVSSPQLVRTPTTRARSDSASSSASLTATEENYARARASGNASVRGHGHGNGNGNVHAYGHGYGYAHSSSYMPPSASASRFPTGAYPPLWTFTAQPIAPTSPDSSEAATSPSDDAEEDEEDSDEVDQEADDLIFVSRASSSTSMSSHVRNRRGGGGSAKRRGSEGHGHGGQHQNQRSVTTARGQPCAGETETELDELPIRLPTSRNVKSRPVVPLLVDFLVPFLFQATRFLSVVPATFGMLYNLYLVFRPPPTATNGVTISSVDYVVCALWAILTGFQCLFLTSGLLSRWKAYYTTVSTLIRLVALQGICWPATHFTLVLFDHTKRPLTCWALIGTTTCLSRSVQLWVTSNLYMGHSTAANSGGGRVLRGEGRAIARLGLSTATRRVASLSPILLPVIHSRFRQYSSAAKRRPIVGIRREDPQRIWERRSPLTPGAVDRLVNEHGIDVLVQPCERRVWKDEDFLKAGARMHPTLAPADVILGIKETPLDEVLSDPAPNSKQPRTHIMFSHTHKGQKYNAPLLSKFIAGSGPGGNANTNSNSNPSSLPTLIDWELLTNGEGKRTVGFGWFAGVAGALEGLLSTALLHLNLGVASPFLGAPRPHTGSLPLLLALLQRIGDTIATNGTPKSMGPFIVTVTGSGQVSAGVLYSLRETLPTQDVTVKDLPRLIRDPSTPLNKIYLLHATQETYLFNRTTGEPATREAYYANPGQFESQFSELIAPYTTLLINGVGWSADSPRLMTVEQTASALVRVRELQQELQASGRGDVMKGRCQSFADVSCDIEGGLGFLTRPSTLSEPSFSIDLHSAFPDRQLPAAPLPPLQMMSVDILPTSLPLEASERFCRGVVPYVRSVASRYGEVRMSGIDTGEKVIDEAVERATIASSGRLRKQHEWLQGMVDEYRKSESSAAKSDASSASTGHGSGARPPLRKKILLLGSGMVAGPTVEEICRRKDVELIVASDQESRNASLCQHHENATPVTINMTQQDKVEELVKGVDVIISLLPVPFHPAVAELCIKHQRHLVTASYISPAMRALHERAANSNVLLLNEIGLDPGIDHCSALSLLASLKREGKKVVSFSSFCGGLPAPECSDVPLKYKFSWSPRGVLSAALNGAQFLVGGKTYTVPSENLLRSNVSRLPVSEVLQLEGLPNRDSLSYSTTYDLHAADGLQTLFRGTIRYPGFCELLLGFKQLGLLDTDRLLRITSYSDLIRASVEDLTGSRVDSLVGLQSALRDLTSTSDISNLFDAVQWLSREANDMPKPPTVATPVIDLFATLLAHKLAYKPGERDLVVLHHEFITSSPSANPSSTMTASGPHGDAVSRDEVHTSALEVYGTPAHSAMALCVGVPAALAALRVLDGGYKQVGVRGPDHPDMYEFVLEGMQERGLRMKHRTSKFVEGRSVESRLREIWK
ncbi:hypothetical protein ACEPAH_9511 [Sanghuangporus vaninii]